MHLLLCLFSFVSFSTAHFILQYPHSLGFDDANEGTAPCGGFSVSFNDSDDSVPVGGFPGSMLSTHPASDWLFRATLDQKEPFNWTNLLPVVSETGLGQFCLPNLKAPDEFTGKTGLLQIVQHGPDGILYQVCLAHEQQSLFLRHTDRTVPRPSVHLSTSSRVSIIPSAPAARMSLV